MLKPCFYIVLVLFLFSCNAPDVDADLIGRWQYWKSTNFEGVEHVNFIPDSIILEYRRDGTGIEQFRYSVRSKTTWKFRDTTLRFSYSYIDDQLRTKGLDGFGNGTIEFLDPKVHTLNTGKALFWFKKLEDRP